MFKSRLITSSNLLDRKIITYGIICYSKSSKKYLTIKNRYSSFFKTIIFGEFRNSNLIFLLENLNKFEKQLINELSIDLLYKYRKEFNYNLDVIFINDLFDRINNNNDNRICNCNNYKLHTFPMIDNSENNKISFNNVIKNFRNKFDIGIDNNNILLPIPFSYKIRNELFQLVEYKYYICIFDKEIDFLSNEFNLHNDKIWLSKYEINLCMKNYDINIIEESEQFLEKYN